MKRTLFILAMILCSVMLSCKPQDETGGGDNSGNSGGGNDGNLMGIYNPEKKIKKISEYVIYNIDYPGYEDYRVCDEEFVWYDDKLIEINRVGYAYYDCFSLYTYNENNQIESLKHNHDGEYEYLYRYKNGKLSEIITDNYAGDDLSCKINYDNSNRITGIYAEFKNNGEVSYNESWHVVWQGDNIKQVTNYENDGDVYDHVYEYDDKINPFYGLFASIIKLSPSGTYIYDFRLLNVSKNNCTVRIDNNNHKTTYTYSYDDDGYPISVDENISGAPCTYRYIIEYFDDINEGNDNNDSDGRNLP